MFKSRSGHQGHPAAAQPQSIEAVRRRARHRLVGAAILVVLGVVGFPLLFDTQPRPLSGDVPIVIPSRDSAPVTAKPETAAAPRPAPAEPVAKESSPPATPLTTQDSLGDREEVVEARAVPVAPEPPLAKPAAPAVAAKTPVKPEAPAAGTARADNAERVKALLEDRAGAAKPGEAANLRLVVQVGAFAEAARAQETRLKLERAGLKTYTHVAETPDGRRTRVRLGPFASRAEAEKAVARVKALGLPAAILVL
ncbi:SPOR domain-containing protein [Hydrogenophaga sp. NFH-34]|uniref:SPOR domain-containing protein n=1 Tax=Hydrogenophaga sp. NFH-34 TaxID=2744446 RepID=UPI001F2DA6D2|nr:SPOR domain-containing protein [Hydrogenophaga sp. NFH-34]